MRFVYLAGTAFVVAACAGKTPAPEAGHVAGLVPDLRGVRVMVLPVQRARGLEVRSDPDAEVEYALSERGVSVDWIWPGEIRAIAGRTPGLDMNVDGLPVSVFLQAEVQRIGDPLYGNLRRLSAVANADIALVPVDVRENIDETGQRSVEIAATLIQTRTGRVLWFGIVAGEHGDSGAQVGLARAAGLLARAILPLSGN